MSGIFRLSLTSLGLKTELKNSVILTQRSCAENHRFCNLISSGCGRDVISYRKCKILPFSKCIVYLYTRTKDGICACNRQHIRMLATAIKILMLNGFA